MDKRSVELHEDAAHEFISAFEWYFSRNEIVAVRFSQDVNDAIEHIAQFPERYPEYFHQSRKFVLRHFPFLIVYRELPSSIQILAIAHAARRPGYWKNRE